MTKLKWCEKIVDLFEDYTNGIYFKCPECESIVEDLDARVCDYESTFIEFYCPICGEYLSKPTLTIDDFLSDYNGELCEDGKIIFSYDDKEYSVDCTVYDDKAESTVVFSFVFVYEDNQPVINLAYAYCPMTNAIKKYVDENKK